MVPPDLLEKWAGFGKTKSTILIYLLAQYLGMRLHINSIVRPLVTRFFSHLQFQVKVVKKLGELNSQTTTIIS